MTPSDSSTAIPKVPLALPMSCTLDAQQIALPPFSEHSCCKYVTSLPYTLNMFEIRMCSNPDLQHTPPSSQCCVAEPLQDVLALRYCLCSAARCLAMQCANGADSPFTLHLRRMLFFAFSSWTEEGAIPGVEILSQTSCMITGLVTGRPQRALVCRACPFAIRCIQYVSLLCCVSSRYKILL